MGISGDTQAVMRTSELWDKGVKKLFCVSLHVPNICLKHD